jgi:hypothetical protein
MSGTRIVDRRAPSASSRRAINPSGTTGLGGALVCMNLVIFVRDRFSSGGSGPVRRPCPGEGPDDSGVEGSTLAKKKRHHPDQPFF